MEACYLFGAGINCYGVVKFIGKQNIIAIIDNNENKNGFEIEGIEIIGFSRFLEIYQNETIVISAYYASKEIKNQLNQNGIKNYIVAPYMQKGYYESYQDFIIKNKIDKEQIVYIYGENFFSMNLFYSLCDYFNMNEIIFIKDSEYANSEFLGITAIPMEEVPAGVCIVVTTEMDDNTTKIEEKNNTNKFKIVDLYAPFIKRYSELNQFRNIHSGKRCFIIGNGPSLRMEDLDILNEHQEICFGSNWIIKAFEKTKWRPDYYTVVDYNFMRLMSQNLKSSEEKEITVFHAEPFYGDIEKKENYYKYQSIPYSKKDVKFSDDIVDGIYGCLTVTYDMIQIAVYMGFTEIYLLGVDCNCKDKVNHFYKAEDIDMNKLENCTILDAQERNSLYVAWLKGYMAAEKYTSTQNIKIYNATRGGELEIFTRVNFDDLFCNE